LTVRSSPWTAIPLTDGIIIPDDAQKISISSDGEVVAYFDGVTEGQALGNIQLVRFVNEKGAGSHSATICSARRRLPGTPTQLDTLERKAPGLSGKAFLEGSGVDVVKEISELIEAQRGYELNSKVITASDEMLAATTRVK
jgi:flagellar basal-body rod protein FlgG